MLVFWGCILVGSVLWVHGPAFIDHLFAVDKTPGASKRF